MKVYAPDYYNDFSCIADRCGHNCCIGWEIDVDEETLKYYKSLSGEFGTRLVNAISTDDVAPHFILTADERCPFLNDRNLCDIILKLGGGSLCQICTDHPRYRNFFSSRTELGLGLCCEEAARIILTRTEKTRLTTIEEDGGEISVSDGEKAFFDFRGRLFDIVQNRGEPLNDRIAEMLDVCGISASRKSASEWADVYLELERMDTKWEERLFELKSAEEITQPDTAWDNSFEQLLVYFLYRHTADALYDGRLRERVAFAALGVKIIGGLFSAHGRLTMEELIEAARLYSSEIEYCEENIEALLENL